MKVEISDRIDNEHKIEIGKATWNCNENSIRRTKQNTNGIFSPHGSSEIPINGHIDISCLMVECLKYNLISNANMRLVFKKLISSFVRKALRSIRVLSK